MADYYLLLSGDSQRQELERTRIRRRSSGYSPCNFTTLPTRFATQPVLSTAERVHS